MQVEALAKAEPKLIKLEKFRYPEEVEVVSRTKEGSYVLKTLDFEVVWKPTAEGSTSYVEDEPVGNVEDILARTVSGSLKRVRSIITHKGKHEEHHVKFPDQPVEEVFEREEPYELVETHVVKSQAPQILNKAVEGAKIGYELSASLDEIHGLDEKNVKIWIKAPGEAEGNFEGCLQGHAKPPSKVYFVRKTGDYVTCSEDETVKVFNGEDFECKATLTGHKGGATAAAVAPDASYVVTGDAEGCVRVWSAADWSCVKTFTPSPDPVVYVAASETNCLVAHAGETVFVWFCS
eukprot:gene10751-16557_t